MSRAAFARARAQARQQMRDSDVELLRSAGCPGHAQFLIEQRLIKQLESNHAREIESAERRNARCR